MARLNAQVAADLTKVILGPADISRIIDRISHQMLERWAGADDAVLMGVRTRGVPMSERIARRLATFGGIEVPVGALDVTPHRDDRDLREARSDGPTDVPPGGIEGRRVVLVDDVLFSGRTVRAALDTLADLGRPRLVELAVLVDRGHRELPIRADYVGKNLPTALDERVLVSFEEIDARDEVALARGTDAPRAGSADF